MKPRHGLWIDGTRRSFQAKKCRARAPILEHELGLESLCAMSIETLNSAARAAGFAMAMTDEPADEKKTADELEKGAWRPGEAIVLHHAEAMPTDASRAATSFTDWVKGVFGSSGGRAPA